MERENLENLAFNLNSAIEGHPMFQNIAHPVYTHFYYDIFMKEAGARKFGPSEAESFIDEVKPLLNMNHTNAKKELNNFIQTWNAWVMFYKELKKQNLI